VRCTYYIAVFGYKDTAYTLTATTATTTKALSDGVPLTDSVRPREYEDYAFVYLSSSSPTVAAFAATKEKPDKSHHRYSAVVNDTSRDITVSVVAMGSLGVPAFFVTLDGTQVGRLYEYLP
jgi:hypothetical protein